jgi:hypothetical protein
LGGRAGERLDLTVLNNGDTFGPLTIYNDTLPDTLLNWNRLR